MHLANGQLHRLGHPGSQPVGHVRVSGDRPPTGNLGLLAYLTASFKSLVQRQLQVDGCPSPTCPRKVRFCQRDANRRPSRDPGRK